MDILTGHYSDELLESINGLAIGHKMSHSQENISKKDESTDLDGEPARKQGRFNDEEILYVIDTPSEPETHSLSLASTKTILGDAVYPKDGEIKICSNLGDIKRVLQDSVIGRAIVLKQANKKKIEIKDRDAICSIIITHFLNKGIKLNNAGLSAVADRIVDIFPSENKATFYVAPIPKKQSRYNRPEVARGKLVDKQRNKLTAIRKQLKSANNSETNEQSMEEQSEESEDATNAKIWLKQNTKLDQYELIIENWKKAYPIRKLEGKTIQEFFIDWPILSTQIAPELIRLDFEERFPGNNIEITETFDTFFQIVLEQRRCNLTVADNTLLELIDTEITNDSKNAIRLYLLASLVPPRGRTKLGRQHWKPSLPESRDGLFVHVNIAGDIERAKKNRTDFMYRKNLTVQPYVLIVGPSLSNVSCSYVIINEHMYKTPSVLSALDICFKAYKVLDAKYSYECQHLWLLIQWHIYNLKCKFDPKVPFIEDIRF
ncbi:unnamed protein product [Brassicogethes aeneus]|uniref:Uncharacterized protein n=1 Tax=Brassicogethes aeneus TaxID=1431903 RepID=A0A9P0AU84_BRAAE|nr:unnamed protein product [Brassicogethes aeneus]